MSRPIDRDGAHRIELFLRLAREQGCSDLHLTSGLPPLLRLDGELAPGTSRPVPDQELADIVAEILSPAQQRTFEERGSVDLSYQSPALGRFRINICRHFHGIGLFCRVIPSEVPRLADLGLPPSVARFTSFRSGLVLVTGPTGTGKSTTLAALVNEINHQRSLNILTLEEPVEFLHRSVNSQVVQREVGTDTPSFAAGLRAALREDPDVILVGELRDPATISLALEAAETGHFVLGTLHTRGAHQTIDRIVDAYPAEAQAQVRHTLADNLRCVLSQELVRAADGRGRRVAMEILVGTPAVAQLIRDGKTFQLQTAITTGRRVGMQLMDLALIALVRSGEIDPNEAFLRAVDKREFIYFVTDKELLHLVATPPAEPKGERAA
jgi:twitching motility protein PilT